MLGIRGPFLEHGICQRVLLIESLDEFAIYLSIQLLFFVQCKMNDFSINIEIDIQKLSETNFMERVKKMRSFSIFLTSH